MVKQLLSITLGISSLALVGQSECSTTLYDQGEATYYNLLENGSVGNCTFVNDSVKPYYAALATGMYNGAGGAYPAEFCGACLEVTGPLGTEIIQVVDQCPTCILEQDLDLSPQAFAVIVGPTSVGRAHISWFEVACPWGNKPLDVIIQGSNQWYGKVIIAGHKNRINKVEIENGTTWQTMVRGEDNGWVKGGLGGHASFRIRVTDIFGEEIIVPGVDLSVGDGRVIGPDNFTGCYITGEEEINSFDYISTFPNPATNMVTFEGINKVDEIRIFNTLGVLVDAITISNVATIANVDISSYTTGMYAVQMISNNQLVHRTNLIKK